MSEWRPPWLARHIEAGARRDEMLGSEISRSGDFEHATVLWRDVTGAYYRQDVICLTPDDIVIFDILVSMSVEDACTCLEQWSPASTLPADERGPRLQTGCCTATVRISSDELERMCDASPARANPANSVGLCG